MSSHATWTCTLLMGLLSTACSSDHAGTGRAPWDDRRTQVLDDDRTFTRVEPAADDACIDYAGACLKPAEKCGREAADIVLDRDGKLLDALCYPAPTLAVEELDAQQGVIPQHDNNTVLVLDTLDDGADITGDVLIDANNVVLYGETSNNAVLAGSLTLDGNNALVRGIRIQGDVTVKKNNAVLAFCVIEGDLIIEGNNVELLACDVLGSVRINGNNTKIYASHVAGGISPAGKNTDCREVFAATDRNADLRVDASEIGAQLSCK